MEQGVDNSNMSTKSKAGDEKQVLRQERFGGMTGQENDPSTREK
jgi:hypothetical protein